jgi:hypothetical protein
VKVKKVVKFFENEDAIECKMPFVLPCLSRKYFLCSSMSGRRHPTKPRHHPCPVFSRFSTIPQQKGYITFNFFMGISPTMTRLRMDALRASFFVLLEGKFPKFSCVCQRRIQMAKMESILYLIELVQHRLLFNPRSRCNNRLSGKHPSLGIASQTRRLIQIAELGRIIQPICSNSNFKFLHHGQIAPTRKFSRDIFPSLISSFQ